MQICPLLQIKAIESPKTTTTGLHVLPQHPRHMYCGTVKTKFFQSFLCLSYPMYTSCGHYIHKSTAKTNKQINKTTIILILVKTQKNIQKALTISLRIFWIRHMLYQMIWFLYVPFQWCWQEYVRPYLINENVGNIIQRINHYPVEKYL